MICKRINFNNCDYNYVLIWNKEYIYVDWLLQGRSVIVIYSIIQIYKFRIKILILYFNKFIDINFLYMFKIFFISNYHNLFIIDSSL